MGDVQDRLAAIWLDLLKCGDVSEQSDFFECGGTSIKAVYLAAGIHEAFGVPVDAIEVVIERTLGNLAALIAARLAPAA